MTSATLIHTNQYYSANLAQNINEVNQRLSIYDEYLSEGEACVHTFKDVDFKAEISGPRYQRNFGP
jgi:hypothetical protein